MWNAGIITVIVFLALVMFINVRVYKTISSLALFAQAHSKFSLLIFFVTFWLILFSPAVFKIELFSHVTPSWEGIIDYGIVALLGAALLGICVQIVGVLLKE